MEPSTFLHVLPGGKLVEVGDELVGGYLFNLTNGKRWTFPKDCTPVTVMRGELLAICRDKTPKRKAVVTSIGADGIASRLAPVTIGRGNEVISGQMAPDGRQILAEVHPPCGDGYTVLFSTETGAARSVIREHSGAFASEPLGWATDGRAVVGLIRLPNCDSSGRTGIYLANPKTLERALVYPQAWLPMWNPAPPPTRP